jgi:6-phosphofructokinase 2
MAQTCETDHGSISRTGVQGAPWACFVFKQHQPLGSFSITREARMKPIVTVTLNPAIDGASETEKVRAIHKMRTSNERYDPGGGGINAARVIRELEGNALAIYLAGGATGPILDALLRKDGLECRCIGIAGHTRISHAVFERSSGQEYRFVPDGPQLLESEWRNCLDVLNECEMDYLVASGSLPRGAPEDIHVRMMEIARAKGAKFVLDSSGPGLHAALDAGGVHLVKPSLGEFEQLTGRSLREPEAQHKAALDLVAAGKADLIAVTLGRDGAFLASSEGVLRLRALDVQVRSATGAGDSFLGAMTLGLAQGRSAAEAFKLGIAAGAAAVLTPGTELCRREDVERLLAELQARER